LNDDAEHDAVEPGDDAAVVFGRPRVDRDRMALGGIADFSDALVEQQLEHGAAIVAGAPHQEIIGGLAPILLHPFDVRLEAAGGGDQRARIDDDAPEAGQIAAHRRGGQEHAVFDLEIDDFGLVGDLDAELLGGPVQRIEHRPAAAQEEGIGAAEAERPAERRLETHALRGDPIEHRLRFADHVAGQRLVGVAAGHPHEIVEEFVLGVGTGQLLGGGVVGAAHVAGVPGVAAAVEFRRDFKHQHRGAGPPRADGGAQRSIAAARHQHVVFFGQIRHLPSH
jgi:hypothetical protein